MAPRAKGVSSPAPSVPPAPASSFSASYCRHHHCYTFPSFLFSRNRDSWASTKGFHDRRVYPATREPRNSIPPFLASPLRPRDIARENRAEVRGERERERDSEGSEGKRELQKDFHDFRAGDPSNTTSRVSTNFLRFLRGFYFPRPVCPGKMYPPFDWLVTFGVCPRRRASPFPVDLTQLV